MESVKLQSSDSVALEGADFVPATTAEFVDGDETTDCNLKTLGVGVFHRADFGRKLDLSACPGDSFSNVFPNRDTGSDACPFIESPDIYLPVTLLHCINYIASEPERSCVGLLQPFECCKHVNSRLANFLCFLAAITSFVVQ